MARWTKKPDVPLASGAMPSLLFNNLSAVSRLLARRRRPPVPKSPGNPPAQAYCHGDEVSIVDLSNGSKRSLPFRQKPVKVFDAKLCSCNGALILVVAVIDGVQLWQLDAGIKSLRMLLCHNLSSGSKDGSDEVANPETAVFARGIARSQRGRHVCVGCSSGAVLVFGTAEPEVDVQLERWVPAHGSPVTAVAASTRGDDVVVSADECGELRLWELPSFTPRGRESDGKDRGLLDAGDARDPCTGLALVGAAACRAGPRKGATFPTSKAPLSASFHSFRLSFGRAIIPRSALEARMLFLERARAEHPRWSDVASRSSRPGRRRPRGDRGQKRPL